MRVEAEGSSKSLPDLSRPVIVREALRALIAFALYLALYPAWRIAGAHDLYETIILKSANAIILATQHFPIYSTIETLRMRYLDFLPIFVVSTFLVSIRVDWARRLRRFGALLFVILALHVAGFILETKVDTAQELLREEGLLLLLPWEFRIVDGFKYLLVDFGLNIGPFVVLLLGFAWNAGTGLFSRPGQTIADHNSRKRASSRNSRGGSAISPWTTSRVIVAALLVLGVGAATWRLLRESDPRHIQTHARLGQLFLRSDQWTEAEAQYAIALKSGTTDGQAWLNMALLHAKSGRTDEAIRLLQRGFEVVKDRNWRQQIQDARKRLLNARLAAPQQP